MNRIRLWPLRRDDHSGVLTDAGGTRRSDWPAQVLANDVSTRIDRASIFDEVKSVFSRLLVPLVIR